MTALVFLAFFVGGFVGCVAMALAAAAKDAEDRWDWWERGYRSGVDDAMDLNAVTWPAASWN